MIKWSEITMLCEGSTNDSILERLMDADNDYEPTDNLIKGLIRHQMQQGPAFGEFVWLREPFTILDASDHYDIHSSASPYVQDAFPADCPQIPLGNLPPHYEGPFTVWGYTMIAIGGPEHPTPYLFGQRRHQGPFRSPQPTEWEILFS